MVSRTRNPHQWRHYKNLDDAIHNAYREIGAYLEGLSDLQLEQVRRMVENLSTTNCGRLIYAGRDVLKHAIHDARMKRTPAKKAV